MPTDRRAYWRDYYRRNRDRELPLRRERARIRRAADGGAANAAACREYYRRRQDWRSAVDVPLSWLSSPDWPRRDRARLGL